MILYLLKYTFFCKKENTVFKKSKNKNKGIHIKNSNQVNS